MDRDALYLFGYTIFLLWIYMLFTKCNVGESAYHCIYIFNDANIDVQRDSLLFIIPWNNKYVSSTFNVCWPNLSTSCVEKYLYSFTTFVMKRKSNNNKEKRICTNHITHWTIGNSWKSAPIRTSSKTIFLL